jgi:D-alanyl-D-alanine carboxypeptidase (penicillin-binding protein 5/6)
MQVRSSTGRKILLTLLCLLPAATLSARPLHHKAAQSKAVQIARADDPYPKAAASYATAVDEQLLWSRNLDTHRSPASLTKLLTALVVLGSDKWNPNAMLPVSRAAATIQKTRVGLKAGDAVNADDALTAMLVHSANDACMVLAEATAGTPEAFADLMNKRAAEIGMHDSHFVHPCGFDEPGQFSTARDLLRLALVPHANTDIARVTSMESAVILTQNDHQLSFHNTNRLLGRMDGVIGLKTGYTVQAGRCLIAVAEEAGHKVWLVLLDSRQRWWIAQRMMSDAMANARNRNSG